MKRPSTILGLALLSAPILCVIVAAWGWWALSLPRGGASPIVSKNLTHLAVVSSSVRTM